MRGKVIMRFIDILTIELTEKQMEREIQYIGRVRKTE